MAKIDNLEGIDWNQEKPKQIFQRPNLARLIQEELWKKYTMPPDEEIQKMIQIMAGKYDVSELSVEEGLVVRKQKELKVLTLEEVESEIGKFVYQQNTKTPPSSNWFTDFISKRWTNQTNFTTRPTIQEVLYKNFLIDLAYRKNLMKGNVM